MDNNYYEEKLETLDENLKYAIIMSDWQDHILKIRDSFRLHIDQTQVLENATVRLMFGDIDAPDFINIMFNDAHISSQMAADILLDIDLKILKDIRERLERMEQEEKENEELEEILMPEEERLQRIENEEYAKMYEELDKEFENMPEEDEEIDHIEIPDDIEQEKEDMLNEIENMSSKPIMMMNEIKAQPLTDTTHQLQNTHIETPYKEDEIIPETASEQVPEPIPEPVIEIKNEPKPITPKKPITISMSDIYREPIE